MIVTGGNGNSAGSAAAVVPVTGMFFLHPDHLGSITMITDGRGNVISGGNNGGKSHISYTPYGSIHRTDSSGPDITRFKFTGQEEDKESGLLYYRARYYDPMLGRFLQADSVVMPESTFGMNRYMYVEGNPVRFGDDSGHKRTNGAQEKQIQYLAVAVYAYDHPAPFSHGDKLASVSLAALALDGSSKHSKKYDLYDALADVSKGFQRGAHDLSHANNHAIRGGLEWASHGLQRAADTVNIVTFGRHHNENSIWHKARRSDLGELEAKRERFNKGLAGRNRECTSFAIDVVLFALTEGISEIGAFVKAVKDAIPGGKAAGVLSVAYDAYKCAASAKSL